MRVKNDATYLSEMRAVEVEGATAEKLGVGGGVTRVGDLCHGEVAYVLADLGVATT